MARIEHITVKNATRSTLNRLRQIGIEKANRLQQMKERWEQHGYDDVEVVHL